MTKPEPIDLDTIEAVAELFGDDVMGYLEPNHCPIAMVYRLKHPGLVPSVISIEVGLTDPETEKEIGYRETSYVEEKVIDLIDDLGEEGRPITGREVAAIVQRVWEAGP